MSRLFSRMVVCRQPTEPPTCPPRSPPPRSWSPSGARPASAFVRSPGGRGCRIRHRRTASEIPKRLLTTVAARRDRGPVHELRSGRGRPRRPGRASHRHGQGVRSHGDRQPRALRRHVQRRADRPRTPPSSLRRAQPTSGS